MSRPSVNVLLNISANDTPCTNPAGDSNYILLGSGDYLVWRDTQQMTGDLLSGIAYPTVIPESGDSEENKMFLMDYSAGEYVQLPLAGSALNDGLGGNNRYVCAAYFGGATASIPYLEAYDDNTHLTWASKPLGDGVSANSCFKAICTTNGVPGSADWAGTALAGTDSRIALDTIAVPSAKYLYWNIKQLLSDWMINWDTEDWYSNDLVFVIHFTYS
ncbi:MAG: hypothetical protein WC346_00165 [Methanogenium sp.]|jgi:hypothetical protein